MKYLKKSAEVLIGKAGVQSQSHLSDYTATLILPTYYSDESGEDLLGVQVTREHLEQLQNEIDRYLRETTENKPEPESVMSEEEASRFLVAVKQVTKQLQNRSQQKQAQLVIDPRLVMVNELRSLERQTLWSAKLRLPLTLKDFTITNERLALLAVGSSEKEVRAKLDTAFHNLIMAGVNPDSDESKIPDIVQESQQPVNLAQDTRVKPLRLDLGKVTSIKTNEGWKARIAYWNGCNRILSVFGNSESEAKAELYKELIVELQEQYDVYSSSTTSEPGNIKQADKASDKDSASFKLNPSRVMSMKVGADKWEARTKLFNWTSDGLTDLVATASSEEAARDELDKKFLNLAGPMMNFIKFMSQAS
jgi:hypothetical protein